MTNNNIYQSHSHSLEKFDCDGDIYTCSGCKTMGIGTGYRCSQGCNYKLHIECKRARSEIVIEGQTCVFYEIPPRGKNCTLPRKKKYCTKCRTCTACKKDVKGFVYHCSKTDWDFHPSCAKISIKGVTFSLKKDGPSECALCELIKKQQLKGDKMKSSAIEKGKKSHVIEKEEKSSGDQMKSSAIEKEKKNPVIEKEEKSSGCEKKKSAIKKEKRSSGDKMRSSAIKKENKSHVIEKEEKSSGDKMRSSAIKKENKSHVIEKEEKSSGDKMKSSAIEKEKKNLVIEKEEKSSGDKMRSSAIEKHKRSRIIENEEKSSGDENKNAAIEKEKKSSGDRKKSPAIENEKESSSWSYVSDDGDYSFHVNCATNLCWLISSTSSKSNKGDSFLTIIEKHLKIESKKGGLKSSNKWLKISSILKMPEICMKMLEIFIKTVISIFLGDPTTLIVSAATDFLSRFFVGLFQS